MAEPAKRPQLGFAEATLTLDNSDRALAYDADEVVVTGATTAPATANTISTASLPA